MPRELLPPRGVFVPSSMIYNTELSDTIRLTWMMLRGMAWGKTEVETTWTEIYKITKYGRSTVYGHMQALRDWGALRWRSSRGLVILSFPEDGLSRFLDSSVKEELTNNNNDLTATTTDSYQSAKNVQKAGQKSKKLDDCAANGYHDVLDEDILEKLGRLKVDRSLLPEVAEKVRTGGWTVPMLWTLVDASMAGNKPGGLFMHKLRTEKPLKGAVCPSCGMIGGHAEGCSKRYTSGAFADYVNTGIEEEVDDYAEELD